MRFDRVMLMRIIGCMIIIGIYILILYNLKMNYIGNGKNQGRDYSYSGAYAKCSAVGFYFDTVISIELYGVDEDVATRVLQECDRYEKLLSKTIEGSDVWKINHSNGEYVKVSDDMINIIKKSIEISVISNGAFDITVAPIVELWGFNSDDPKIPNRNDISELCKLINYSKIDIRGSEVSIQNGMKIDTGGVAKGYIADRISEFCIAEGVDSGILNFGGNVVLIGSKPGEDAWRVGVKYPERGSNRTIGSISVAKGCIVTSGIYERSFELNGIIYHHIIDTDNGWPIDNELASVTIVGDSAMEADALSTAVLALGTIDGMDLIENYEGVEALLITRSGDIIMSDGMTNIYEKGL